MTAPLQKLESILAEFENTVDVGERIDLLLDYADRFKEIPLSLAIRPFSEENHVPYCESEAFVWVLQQEDRTVKLYFAVENPSALSVKSLAVILDESLSGLYPENIVDISSDIVYKIFGNNVSMGKGQGLVGIIGLVVTGAKKLLA